MRVFIGWENIHQYFVEIVLKMGCPSSHMLGIITVQVFAQKMLRVKL